MSKILHITSGDMAGGNLEKSGVPGEIFVWHDLLYDGPRKAGWPDGAILNARAQFLEQMTAGGLDKAFVLETLDQQYRKLAEADAYDRILLWFDACLFDQSMLVHILSCLNFRGIRDVELICVDAFPGIEPFHGIGQLSPDQLASLQGRNLPVTEIQFLFAVRVDRAFAIHDSKALVELSKTTDAPLPWIPAAAARWLREQPDPTTGLGHLEALALRAIQDGCETPGKILASVVAAETPPRFWGDTTLWMKINGLAGREPPLVKIQGPTGKLPQWESRISLNGFRITPT